MKKYDLSGLDNAKTYQVEYLDCSANINSDFVKEFRKKNNITQIRLANLLHVTKKTIEKWEQGKNPIKGTSAILLYLLDKNPNLIKQLYREERNYDLEEVSNYEEETTSDIFPFSISYEMESEYKENTKERLNYVQCPGI